MVEFFKKLKHDDRGATAVEYGLILALIFLAMVGAVQTFADTTADTWAVVTKAVEDSRP